MRTLEGALIRVVAFSSLTGRPLTAELAAEVLGSLYPRAPSPGRPRAARSARSRPPPAGTSASRPTSSSPAPAPPRIAWPRQLAMYLARELTGASLPAIGREFGGRDHTTVLHACRRANERISADAAAREAVEKLFTDLGGRTAAMTPRPRPTAPPERLPHCRPQRAPPPLPRKRHAGTSNPHVHSPYSLTHYKKTAA